MDQKRNYLTITVGLLGALKLILATFGIEIQDADIDGIANGLASLVAVGAVIHHHFKKTK